MKTPNVAEALRAAVNALYFEDSADYGKALWSVVDALDPEISKLLDEGDGSKAFKKVNPDV